MADESFLELDDLDSSTITVFVKLQAYVRGYLVRRLLDEIRLEYEDIVRDVERDSVVGWPSGFGVPIVRGCSKRRKQEQCVGRDSLRQQQNQADVSPRSVPQLKHDNRAIPFSNFRDSQLHAESDYITNSKGRQKGVLVLDSNSKGKRVVDDHCSPLPFLGNNACAVHSHRDDRCDMHDSRGKSEQSGPKVKLSEVSQSRFDAVVECCGWSNDVERQNCNINRNASVSVWSGSINDIQNENRAVNAKITSVADQGIQIDLVPDSLPSALDKTEVSIVGPVSRQIQVDEIDFVAVSEKLEANSCVCENSYDSDNNGSSIMAGKGWSSQSIAGDSTVNDAEMSSGLGQERANSGASVISSGATFSETNGAGDEVVPRSGSECGDRQLAPEVSSSTQTADIPAYHDVPSLDDAVTTDVFELVDVENRQVMESNVAEVDSVELGLCGQGSSSHPVSQPEVESTHLAVEAPCKDTGEVEGGSPTTFPDLPDDKNSLLNLKKTLTMELLWIQQAINSRKHYLRLKQQLV